MLRLMTKLRKLYTIHENLPSTEIPDDTDVDFYFFDKILDVCTNDKRLIRISKGPLKNLYAIKKFQFCDRISQQNFHLVTSLVLQRKEICNVIDKVVHVLKMFDKINASNYYSIPTPLQSIGKTLQQDQLFLHYYIDIQCFDSSIIRVGFRLNNHRSVFLIKHFTLQENNFILSREIDLLHKEFYSLYKSRVFLEQIINPHNIPFIEPPTM